PHPEQAHHLHLTHGNSGGARLQRLSCRCASVHRTQPGRGPRRRQFLRGAGAERTAVYARWRLPAIDGRPAAEHKWTAAGGGGAAGLQGYRELSNVQPATELVAMIRNSRYFEAAQRALRTLSESVQLNTKPQ